MVLMLRYSDANARFVKMADQACHLGGSLASESYLRGDKIIEIAKLTGANAIHPGYGFLSENAEFAEKVSQAGIVFIGPTPESIRILGDKVSYFPWTPIFNHRLASNTLHP